MRLHLCVYWITPGERFRIKRAVCFSPPPSDNDLFAQCWLNAGSPSTTLTQHSVSDGSACQVSSVWLEIFRHMTSQSGITCGYNCEIRLMRMHLAQIHKQIILNKHFSHLTHFTF